MIGFRLYEYVASSRSASSRWAKATREARYHSPCESRHITTKRAAQVWGFSGMARSSGHQRLRLAEGRQLERGAAPEQRGRVRDAGRVVRLGLAGHDVIEIFGDGVVAGPRVRLTIGL